MPTLQTGDARQCSGALAAKLDIHPTWKSELAVSHSRNRTRSRSFVLQSGDLFGSTDNLFRVTTFDAGVDGTLWRAPNLFNQRPPFVKDSVNGVHFDGTNASAVGRVVALQITKKW